MQEETCIKEDSVKKIVISHTEPDSKFTSPNRKSSSKDIHKFNESNIAESIKNSLIIQLAASQKELFDT
jgi:hypothetical protein